jgi:uncharacterized CHY-type Zn-finger protein
VELDVEQPKTEMTIDDVANRLFGRTRSESLAARTCVMCGKPATAFKDELSRREYEISALCQGCQDVAFSEDEDEDDSGA